MFRPLLLASSVALLIGGSAAAMAAPSASAHRTMICPEATGATYPCCGPIQAHDAACCTKPVEAIEPICCPPNAVCATPLTISSSPNPSTAPHKVVVSGDASGAAAGTVVTLFQRLAGQSTFKQVSSGKTDSTGAYKITMTGVMTNRQWYVTEQSARSTTVSQSVRASMTFKAIPSPGGEVTFGGHVSPAQGGAKVLIEQLKAGTWRVIARARLGHSSDYQLRHHFAAGGRIELRAALRGNARNTGTFSHSSTITVG
jgi:hypothetical protein